jgi:3-phosphoshikimate 1-carboxyvinyltransferase
MNKPESLFLPHAKRAQGTIRLPGSKSISNRALLLAALSQGETHLDGVLDSDDTRVMREALQTLGVKIEVLDDPRTLRIHGVGAAGFPVKSADIFVGNSGTSARSLAAVLALCDGNYVMAGVARMHERPIEDLIDALRPAGAQVRYMGNPGCPPIEISPRNRQPASELRVKGDVSSQFLSAVLMALPLTGQATTVVIEGDLVSKPYVGLTLALMQRFGVTVTRKEWQSFEVPAAKGYVSPGRFAVEGDASSASYFLAAGALGGGPVRVEGVGSASAQGDVGFAEVLRAMGARIEMGEDWIESSGGPPLHAIDLDMNMIPDAAMTAAVLTLFCVEPCTIRNVASWRVKETDRIAAMATELRKFGARVQEGANFLRIFPPKEFLRPRTSTVAPVTIDTYDDHRMAMCFSLASFGPRPVRIMDPACVAKTFPEYFQEFGKLIS